ncbi:MAG: Na+/H+ antiporter subunit E [Candidatus Bipolaricaulota bacterium]
MVGLLTLVAMWFSLTRSAEPLSFLVAACLALGAMGASRWVLPRTEGLGSLVLRRPHRAIAFLVGLVWQIARSTLYTCRVILFRREEGRIVALPTALHGPLAQFLLSHAVTLTPSTISLLVEEDLVYIHWLGVEGHPGDLSGVKEPLERLLARWTGGQADARP